MSIRCARSLVFVALLACYWSIADAQPGMWLEGLLFDPATSNAKPFQRGEMVWNAGIVRKIDFSGKSVIVTLSNDSAEDLPVDISIYVVNKYGLVVWNGRVHWLTKLKAGSSYAETLAFNPSPPDGMGFSRLADQTPGYVIMLVNR